MPKNHLSGLNAAQRRAVTATRGPVLVLAGAGTGKTRVITARMAELLAGGVSPKNILAVTFTNKAAREMKERVSALVGKKRAAQLTVGTFHRFCLDLLREHTVEAGLSRRFTICDAADQLTNVKKALRELHVADATINPRAALMRISLLKNRLVRPEEHLEGATDDMDELIGRAYRRYEDSLRRTSTVDFDDLLLLTEKLLRTNDKIRAAVRRRFQYVMVDEYQDTNGVQYGIVHQVAGGHRNLCVVGDDDQSIYAWRGADVARILRFEDDYPGAVVVRLETNYRSTRPILDAANRIISHNTARHEKSLQSALGDGEPVRLRECVDEVEEADSTVREIQGLLRSGKARHGDIAILFRTGTQPRVFETQLRARGVPYVLVGGPSFFDRKEVRDVLALLRLIENEEDEASFLRVVNCPPRGIGKTSLERVIAHASANEMSVMRAFEESEAVEGLKPAAAESAQSFLRLIATLRGRSRSTDVVRFIGSALEVLRYREEVERRYPDAQTVRERWAAVDEVLNAAENHMRRKTGACLSTFLQELTLSADDDTSTEDADQRGDVTLMTLHSAKGLEFPRVYLVGLEEGLLPHARSVDEGSVEEERRLMYVGVTRAQRHLTLSFARLRSRGGQRIPVHPSRFLFELRGETPPDTWLASGAVAKKKPRKKRRGGRYARR